MITAQNVGVDMAAKSFHACLMIKTSEGKTKIKGQRKFANTPKGISAFSEWLKKKMAVDQSLSITMEATGVYYERLAYRLYDYGYKVHVLLPNRIKGYLKFLNLKSKTDKLETKALAQLGLDHNLPAWQPSSPQMYLLKRLSRERTSLLEEKTMISNRWHAEQSCQSPDAQAIKRLECRIDLLIEQVKEVELQMQQKTEADKDLTERIKNICKVKGLGLVTVISIIAETNGFALVKHKSQLVSYAGYDVVERESGTSVRGKTKISKKGNRYIRHALHFPAITVVKYQEEFKALYERVFDRTKIKMKGYVAVQRKLLVLIYTLYKKNQPYDPHYANAQVQN